MGTAGKLVPRIRVDPNEQRRGVVGYGATLMAHELINGISSQ